MSNNLPLVSISCITYNHADYIRHCLDGFLMQKTSFLYEIVIHDDASTDDTQKILEEYGEKYPEKVRLIIQKENQYSKGIKSIIASFMLNEARGKYLAICEGDDVQLTNGVIIETHHHTFHSNYQASRADIRPSTLNIGGGLLLVREQ